MLSLRHRRDQQFKGIRTLKPARVVNKGGDSNVNSLHLPQKSARFLKDFVHTLVILCNLKNTLENVTNNRDSSLAD